jgi:cell wall-associated NlpC family hydrolase
LALERLREVATRLTDTRRWSGVVPAVASLAHWLGSSVKGNAIGEWKEAVRTGKGHAADRNLPAGAVVYYEGGTDGHADIYIGDGWVVSTAGYWWEAKPVRLHQIAALPGLQYRGWAMPLR